MQASVCMCKMKRKMYDVYFQGDDYLQVARVLNIKRTTSYNIKRAIENKKYPNLAEAAKA